MKYLSIFIYLLGFSSFAFGQIENLDATFGNSGVAAANFFSDWDEAKSAIRYPDGKILMAGRTQNAQSKWVLCVARFMANGQPDLGFGNQGRATLMPNDQDNMVKVVDPVVQPDGKILLPGTINVNNMVKQILVRIFPNGLIDNSFATNGYYISSFANEEDICQCGLFPDGRILCLGSNQVSTAPSGLLRSRFSSIRFLANGSIDTSYNGNMFRLHPVATGEAYDTPISAFLLPDSTAIFAGFNQPSLNGTRRMLLAKIGFKGNFDSTFGTNGQIRHLPPYNQFLPTRIKRASVEGFIMTGQARLSGGGQIGNTAVYRFKADGRLDSTFGTNGIATTPFVGVNANNFLAVDFQEDAQGKIWVGHYGQNVSGIRTFAVSRFLANGNIDNSFGGTGYIMTGLAGDANRIFLEPDGFPILTGSAQNSSLTISTDLVAIKVKPTTVSVLSKKESPFLLFPAVVERGTPFQVRWQKTQTTEWQVINSSGQVILEGKSLPEAESTIETKILNPGVYLLRGRSSEQGWQQGRLMVY